MNNIVAFNISNAQNVAKADCNRYKFENLFL